MKCFEYEQNSRLLTEEDWKYKVKLNMLGIQTALQLNIAISLKYKK